MRAGPITGSEGRSSTHCIGALREDLPELAMLQAGSPEVSLVIPSYNSRHDLEITIAQAHKYLHKQSYSHELIIVNDGSTDATEDMLREVQPLYPHLRVLHNNRNRGKGYSVRRGVLSASGRFVLYMDADQAYPIEAVDALLAPLREGVCEIAVGSRMHPLSCVQLHPSHLNYLYCRHLLSRTFNRVIHRLFRLPVSDIQCGLKGFEANAARSVFSLVRTSGFAFDVEALLIAHRLHYRIAELPLTCIYRSDASTVRLLANAGGVLCDLLKIFLWSRQGRYGLPCRKQGR